MSAPPLTKAQARILVSWLGVESELRENNVAELAVQFLEACRALIAIAEAEE